MTKRFLLALTMITATAVSYAKFVIPTTTHTVASTKIKYLLENFAWTPEEEKGRKGLENILFFEEKKKYSECIKAIDEIIKIGLDIDGSICEGEMFLWGIRAEYNCYLKNYDQALRDCEFALLIKRNSYFSYLKGYTYYVKSLAWSGLGNENMAKACMKIAAINECNLAQEIVLAYGL